MVVLGVEQVECLNLFLAYKYLRHSSYKQKLLGGFKKKFKLVCIYLSFNQ